MSQTDSSAHLNSLGCPAQALLERGTLESRSAFRSSGGLEFGIARACTFTISSFGFCEEIMKGQTLPYEPPNIAMCGRRSGNPSIV